MRLYHATRKENVESILEKGFYGTTCGDVDELQEDSGIVDIVFFSDSIEALVDEYEFCYFVKPEVILECEVQNPYQVNGRMLVEHEWIGEASEIDVVAMHTI